MRVKERNNESQLREVRVSVCVSCVSVIIIILIICL